MKPFYVYILKCADNSYYTGQTDDLMARLLEHERGTHDGYTAMRRPVQFVFSQEYATREQAEAAEKQFKGWSRAKKEALILGNITDLKTLSQKKSRFKNTAY